MYNFSGLYLNQPFLRIAFNKFDSGQIFNCLLLTKSKTLFSTSSSLLKYIAKPRELLSFKFTKARSKFEKEMINSEMSFYISTGGDVTSTDNGGVFPASRQIETLRRYESIAETLKNDHTEHTSGMEVTLKVMSYNVLSQTLLEQHQYLYEMQSPKILSWKYRSQIILAEILTISPEVLCLQEVEGNHIPTFYKTLEKYGYRGVTKMKTGFRPDGLAIFFKEPNIKLIESETVEFKQPAVVQLASRDNVGLIAKLEKNGKKFLVANTHLLYNPKRTEVRLAQLQIFLAEIDRIKRKDAELVNIFLMGDLNSTPNSPVLTLLNEGKVLSTFRPLPPCLGVSPECIHLEKESKLYHSKKQVISPCEGLEELLPVSLTSAAIHQSYLLSQPFKFNSVYDLTESSARGVTTFQHGWVLVDYMFYSDNIRLMTRLSLPSAAECDLYVRFLPNEVNPSDHLPLVGEFIIY
ncbi:protein angel homolog 2 isoform X2 [Halyomorpha halys]|uniref:protein angel homolog 2 isoform X2 n=1 Tax=Halyomorpha halys TaxID=286706 RepID=UPI0006D52608|nr:protein angel homolog 2 isoform X2 [Halyomorpha halys]